MKTGKCTTQFLFVKSLHLTEELTPWLQKGPLAN